MTATLQHEKPHVSFSEASELLTCQDDSHVAQEDSREEETQAEPHTAPHLARFSERNHADLEQYETALNSDHWAADYIRELLSAFEAGILDFNGAEYLLAQRRNAFEADLAVVRRFLKRYPSVVKDLIGSELPAAA